MPFFAADISSNLQDDGQNERMAGGLFFDVPFEVRADITYPGIPCSGQLGDRQHLVSVVFPTGGRW